LLIWSEADQYRPAELEEDSIEQFWEVRATLSGSVVTVPPANALRRSDHSQYVRRVLWLEERLIERGWSTSDPSRYSGPDRKTIEKILRGEAVRNDVLERLADSLSKKHSKIDVLEIPRD
jgi:hypothetical protein